MLARCKWNCWEQVVVISTAEVGNEVLLPLKKHAFLSDNNCWNVRRAKTPVWSFSHLYCWIQDEWISPLLGWHPLMYLVTLITVNVLILARPKSKVKKPSTWKKTERELSEWGPGKVFEGLEVWSITCTIVLALCPLRYFCLGMIETLRMTF